MTGIDVLVVFSVLNFVLLPCEGMVFPPPDGTELVFLPGKDAKIRWSFDDTLDSNSFRAWYLITDDGTTQVLGRILGAGTVADKVSPGFAIEQGKILVIKNFDENKNGKYRFVFSPNLPSDVVVSVIKKPTVTLTCSSVVSLKEEDDFTCTCLAENGIPASNVTWDKDGKQIGEIEKKIKILELNNVNPLDDGTYTCKAESYADVKFIDEKSIQLTVRLNFQPRKTTITFTQKIVKVGEPINVTCESEGQPEPHFTIKHNNTEVIAEKTFHIPQVKWSDNGLYECIATNKLGSNSKGHCLTVLDEAKSSKKDCDAGDTVVVWHIVVSLILGIVIGCLLSYIVSCSRHKFRGKKPLQANPEPPKPQVDKTYQELDFIRMNKEDNYQSLTVTTNQSAKNGDGNENDSNYTELSQTREAEKTYQSLTSA